MTSTPRHFFFDLDDTLTPSRSPMAPAHVDVFRDLCLARDVIVVTGGQLSQLQKQLPQSSPECPYFSLTQNGNDARGPDGSPLWRESFTDEQRHMILAFIQRVHDDIRLPVTDEGNLIEDRGSQISYSLIGHDEKLEIKRAFDPDRKRRLAILADFAPDVAALDSAGVEITIGGTTCFDIFLKSKNKGYHVARLVERMDWKRDECIYVGDALAPGLNDETVVGVIPTRAVTGPDDTFTFIEEMLS